MRCMRWHSSTPFLGGCNMQFTSLLLYYTCEEFLFLLSGVCLSLRVDPYLSAIQPGTIQHCTKSLYPTRTRGCGVFTLPFMLEAIPYLFHCRIKCASHPWHKLCGVTLVFDLLALLSCGNDREHLGSCGDDNAKCSYSSCFSGVGATTKLML